MSEVAYVDSDSDDVTEIAHGKSQSILVVARQATQLLIFNRQQSRNALTREMRRSFAALLAQADADEDVRSVIVTGAHGAFSSGVDIKESRAQPGEMVRPHPGEALRAFSKPVIAAVDGACITGSLEIALSCDFIIATTRAIFADTHAKIGIFPAWGLTAMLPRAIGVRKARQMMLTGAPISAQLALQWGLVNELVEPAALLPHCLKLTSNLAAMNQVLVVRQKALLDVERSFSEALAAEEEAAALWRGGDRSDQNKP
ncbi:MAG: enoyl-CoA hydratase-related protein [Hyphomonadaceae bacterium]|nr:enoyl-CoA hydratase-related protein [Hyphomonadaceae bacterium]